MKLTAFLLIDSKLTDGSRSYSAQRRRGTTWTTVFVLPHPGSVNGILIADGYLFAASWEETGAKSESEYQLGLYRSHDGGDSWESFGVPESAPAATGRNLVLNSDGALIIGTLSGVWRVEM